MFDYKTIVSDDELTMTFKRKSIHEYEAIVKSSKEIVGTVKVDGGTFDASSDEIFMQYKLWQTRPEAKIGKVVQIEGRSIDSLMSMYEELLIGAYILHNKDLHISIGVEQPYEAMIDWLRTTDFYKAPASTRFHESIVGGLLVHSLKVYNEAMEIRRLSKFKNISIESVALAALTHDWCKIGNYESFKRNVKNEETGQWEQVDSFRTNFKGITLGHGVTSMFLVSRFFLLTPDEALAIRWHQGRWNCCESEMTELQIANAHHPLVHLIQFADQLAVTEYPNESGE